MGSFELLLKTSCRYHEQFQFTFMVMKVVDSNGSGVMILSLQGAIGRGSKPFLKRHPIRSLRQLKMGINLQGSSFNSRMLFVAMPKKHYKSKPASGTNYIIHFLSSKDCLWLSFPVTLNLILFNPTDPLSLLRRISRLYSTR